MPFPPTMELRAESRPQPPARRRRRPHLVGELLIVLILVKVYDYVRSFAAVRHAPAERHGRDVLAVERVLHLDFELVGNRWLTDHHPLALVAAYWYQFTHITVTLAVLAWCYLSGVGFYRKARNALVATNLMGMTVFMLLPVMPPRLLPGGGYIDTVAEAGFGSSHGGPVPADQYAAMPSLHLAWAMWTALVAAALLRGRRGRLLCYAYPVGTGIFVVLTANHYVLDVVAGVATALVTAWIAGFVKIGGYAPSGTPIDDLGQMIRRRSRNASTQAPGTNGTQTVSSRYPSTAPRAGADGTPAVTNTATSTTSRPPMPPGEGTRATTEDTTT